MPVLSTFGSRSARGEGMLGVSAAPSPSVSAPYLASSNTNQFSSASYAPINGFQANANDLLIVLTGSETNSYGNYANVTGINVSGTALTKRKQQTVVDYGQSVEMWYGIIPSAGTWSANILFDRSFDDQSTVILTFTNINTSSPFYYASSVSGSSSGSIPSLTFPAVSSTNGTFAFSFWGTPNPQALGLYTTWNDIALVRQNNAAIRWEWVYCSGKRFATTAWGPVTATGSSSGAWAGIGDVIQK